MKSIHFSAVLIFAVCAVAVPQPARAQTVYCEMVGAAIGAAIGYSVGGPIGGAWQAASSAAAAVGGSAAFSGRCERSLQDFIDYYDENPIDYDAFVRDECGGNPLTCPGNYNNPNDPYAEWPQNCYGLVVSCAMPLPRSPYGTSFTGMSVNDLLDAMTFLGISRSNGYWATDNYGYLVGIDNPGHEIP